MVVIFSYSFNTPFKGNTPKSAYDFAITTSTNDISYTTFQPAQWDSAKLTASSLATCEPVRDEFLSLVATTNALAFTSCGERNANRADRRYTTT